MTNEERQQIADLCREHDALMIEHADWMARREAAASPSMRKSNAEGVLYRTTEQNAQASATPQDDEPSEGEPYPSFTDLRAGITEFVVTWCNRKLAERDAKIIELNARVDMLMKLLAGHLFAETPSKSGDVVELPHTRGFLRRVHNG
jgi:hypothetical protein